MAAVLIYAIQIFCRLLTFALLAEAFLSWFAGNPYSGPGQAYWIIRRFTEPIVTPCRKILARFNTGMFDFSVLLAMIFVQIAERILTYAVLLIAY